MISSSNNCTIMINMSSRCFNHHPRLCNQSYWQSQLILVMGIKKILQFLMEIIHLIWHGSLLLSMGWILDLQTCLQRKFRTILIRLYKKSWLNNNKRKWFISSNSNYSNKCINRIHIIKLKSRKSSISTGIIRIHLMALPRLMMKLAIIQLPIIFWVNLMNPNKSL